MSILIVGQQPHSAKLGKLLGYLGGTIIRCADERQAINKLKHRRTDYQWIFIEATGENTHTQDTLVSHIHAMNMNIPISLITHQIDSGTSPTSPHPSGACSIENNAIEKPKRRRVLDALQTNPQHTAHGFSRYKLDDIFLFEYHAPCKKSV